MNHHYVLAPHDPALEARAAAMVDAHQPGHGVRAVATASSGDFGHVIALQAADRPALDGLLTQLQLPVRSALTSDTSPTMSTTSHTMSATVSVCDDLPCERINGLFDFVPSQLPACTQLAFLLVELKRDIHDVAEDLRLPPVASHLAGVALSDGNQLLLELANDDPTQLAADLELLQAHSDVRAIRTVHAAGSKLVRSPHE